MVKKMHLSLFEIAESWKSVTDEEATFFIEQFYKKFPKAPKEPISILLIRPKNDHNNKTYRRIYLRSEPEIIYRIGRFGNFFEHYRYCGCPVDECEDSCGVD